MPLAEMPITYVFAARSKSAHRVVHLSRWSSLHAFFRAVHGGRTSSHDRLAEDGSMPNVGGNSAASSTPRRPLVPAPTKINRPPSSMAAAMMSAPRRCVPSRAARRQERHDHDNHHLDHVA
jgi:hypothetical protein